MDKIMQVHHALNCLEALPGFKKFEGVNKLLSQNSSNIYKGHTMPLPMQPDTLLFSKNTTAKSV